MYIDKTHFISKLLETSKYIFAVRPRKSEKSLWIDTMKCYFEG